MSLGKKINLWIAGVTVAVLAVTFGVIISLEARGVKEQILHDSTTIAGMLKDDIERLFQGVYDEQQSLQAIVDKLSGIDGVRYVNVTDALGYHIAATSHDDVGKKVSGRDAELFDQALKQGQEIDMQNDEGVAFSLERRIPVRMDEGKNTSVAAVIEVEVLTRSKKEGDVTDAQKLLQSISASIEQSARSIVVTRSSNLETMQKITDEIKHFDFFHDFIVFDNKLNNIASTDRAENEFAGDPPEYAKHREDVLFEKTREVAYERVHEGKDVLVTVSPILLSVGGTPRTVGVFEVHVLPAAYQGKITALVVRMLGIGILLTLVLVAVLAYILRREVVGPITAYSRVAQKVADGDLSQRIEQISHDEIGRFGEVFNAMVSNLYELDRLKTDFITVAAHQLRTPLSSVNWALKLLLDSEMGPVNDDQKSMLARSFDTNSKMIKLVNDLLDVTRIEHGKFVYRFALNDMASVLHSIVQNAEIVARERTVEVRLEMHDPIEPFVFDADKLGIAIQNLVDNAVKYTLPGGKVTVTTSKQGDYLEIKVADTGVGIPKAELPKLFSKFFRATNVVHLQTEGSGLGLVIAKSIVVRHGGQIWADSEEGKGTTFTMRVPTRAELIPEENVAPVDNRMV